MRNWKRMLEVIQAVFSNSTSNSHFLAMKRALENYFFGVSPPYSGSLSIFSASAKLNCAIFDSFALFYSTDANLLHFTNVTSFSNFAVARLYLLIVVVHL